jgi:hypothetical protein
MSIEAMKQALEALNKLTDAAEGFSVSGVYFNEGVWEKECLNTSYAAIKALEEALARKQEQGEPVAWRNAAIRVGEDLCSVGPFGYYDMTAEQWLDWALSVVTVHLPPQQRTWVDLDDDDRHELWESTDSDWELMKRVEAKLRSKNNG